MVHLVRPTFQAQQRPRGGAVVCCSRVLCAIRVSVNCEVRPRDKLRSTLEDHVGLPRTAP
jgi:hypothetical protein